jgi:ABC-type glycerol-3-phosphate transport system substrate-binding protein
MKTKTIIATTLLGLSLAACGGKAAVEDLEKLKDKTCSCARDDAACIDEAKEMAAEWGKKHANARGGDREAAEKLTKEILGCNMSVALSLAGK